MNEKINAQGENTTGAPKKRKIYFKRIAIVVGAALLILIVVISLVFDITFDNVKDFFAKEETQSEEGTSIAGIPFSEVIAKLSVESTEYEGKITKSEKANVEVKDGNIKVSYSLEDGEALIFDRDGLMMDKKTDDFIVGSYATANVSRSKKDSDVIFCEDADSVARVLRYTIATEEMVLLWENDLVYDQYLPITAISNIEKFDNAETKPMAAELYDEEQILVETEVLQEDQVGKVHFGFNDGIPVSQVAIIQQGSRYFVVSQNYIDTEITVEGTNHYSILGNSIERILIYDYENNLIELVYES